MKEFKIGDFVRFDKNNKLGERLMCDGTDLSDKVFVVISVPPPELVEIVKSNEWYDKIGISFGNIFYIVSSNDLLKIEPKDTNESERLEIMHTLWILYLQNSKIERDKY